MGVTACAASPSKMVLGPWICVQRTLHQERERSDIIYWSRADTLSKCELRVVMAALPATKQTQKICHFKSRAWRRRVLVLAKPMTGIVSDANFDGVNYEWWFPPFAIAAGG